MSQGISERPVATPSRRGLTSSASPSAASRQREDGRSTHSEKARDMTRQIHFDAFDMNCVGHQSPGVWAHPKDQS